MQFTEYPTAQLAKLTFDANFKKDSPTKIDDFLIFKEKDVSDQFPPDAAAAVFDLRMRKPPQTPKIIESIWPVVIAAAKLNNQEVKIKAMRSQCGNLWIFAPKIQNGKVVGVAAVSSGLAGNIEIYDIDRKLYGVTVKLPQRRDASYVVEVELDLTERLTSSDLRFKGI